MMKKKFLFTFLLLIMALWVAQAIAIEAEWVTVEGYASLENVTKEEARQKAINDARRAAIEIVVGVEILSKTLVINNEVSGDVVCTLPYGKVIDQEILKENVTMIPTNGKGQAPLLTYQVKMKVKVVKEKGEADPFFQVKAEINRAVYKAGDHIELRITPTKDAYITIFNILEDKTVLILIPNRFKKNSFVKANHTFIFPDEHDRQNGIDLQAFIGENKAATAEMFHVLAMKKPLNFDTATFSEGIYGIYNGSSGLVCDLVKETVKIPLAHRAETFVHYRIEK